MALHMVIFIFKKKKVLYKVRQNFPFVEQKVECLGCPINLWVSLKRQKKKRKRNKKK